MQILETKILKGPNVFSLTEHALLATTILVNGESIAPGTFDSAIKQLTSIFQATSHVWDGLANVEDGNKSIGTFIALLATQLQLEAGLFVGSFQNVEVHNSELLIVVDYEDSHLAKIALSSAIDGLIAIVSSEKYAYQKVVAMIKRRWDKVRFGQLSGSIIAEARKRKIPLIEHEAAAFTQLGYGCKQKRFQKSTTGATSSIGVKIASNKEYAKKLLHSYAIPVPMGRVIKERRDLLPALASVGYPAVIKPASGNNGRGVAVNICTEQDALAAYAPASRVARTGQVIVEPFIRGFDYRLLVIDGKLVAAAKRTPASVIGDGTHTIQELIDIANKDPRRGEGHEKPMTFIQVDETTTEILKEKGLTLNSIPVSGDVVFLKKIGNLSAGGSSSDVTDVVHPDNVLMAERIAKITGLDICGMDIISPNISVPLLDNGGAVVEVNSAPGFRLHMEPAEGQPRDVAADMISMLFPHPGDERIPLIASHCADASFSVEMQHALSKLLGTVSHIVGHSSADGLYIGNAKLKAGDNRNFLAAQVILRDPVVSCALIGCVADSVAGEGLAFTYAHISIIAGRSNWSQEEENEFTRTAKVIGGITIKEGYVLLDAGSLSVNAAIAIAGSTMATVIWYNLAANKELKAVLTQSYGSVEDTGKSISLTLPDGQNLHFDTNGETKAIVVAAVTKFLLDACCR